MQAPAECPNEAHLRALIDGSLRDPDAAAVTAHLDGCQACRRRLDRLAEGSYSPDDIAGRIHLQRESDSPALQKVLDGLRARGSVDPTGPSVGNDAGDGRPATEPAGPPFPHQLGPYRVERLVGEGGMGRVVKAYEPSLHRVVAIKLMAAPLAANGVARGRFRREAIAAASVVHEHVVTIHGVHDDAGVPYIVMQYVQGKSLQERIDSSAPLGLREVLRIGMQVASGLAAAHAQGIVHRDIKPSNILLENGVERVKITDFGLARVHDDGMTASGVISGTPQYMSPEQAQGDPVSPRSDLFSLGGVLFAMCTGEPPFRGGHPLAVLKRVCEAEPRPIQQLNPEVPDWLAAIITKLMAKSPSDRFDSAEEVADLLGRHLAHLHQPAMAPMPERVEAINRLPNVSEPPSKTWRRRLIGLLAVTMIATVVGFGAVRREPGAPLWLLTALGIVAIVMLMHWALPRRRIRPEQQPATPRPRPRRWSRIIAVVVPVLGGIAVLGIKVGDEYGMPPGRPDVQISVADPDVTVRLVANGRRIGEYIGHRGTDLNLRLKPGRYHLTAFKDGLEIYQTDFIAPIFGKLHVEVPSSQLEKRSKREGPRTPATGKVVVRCTTLGEPDVGATVELLEDVMGLPARTGAASMVAMTDADGVVTFSAVKPGKYVVSVRDERGAERVSRAVTVEGSKIAEVKLDPAD